MYRKKSVSLSADFPTLQVSAKASTVQDSTHYPILPTVAPNNPQIGDDYNIQYFPTIYKVCPNRIITEVGQVSATNHYAMVIECPLVSIIEQDSYDELTIYPNPTTGIINIIGEKDATVSIYNTTGKLVGEYNNLKESIDLSKEANGAYVMMVRCDDFVNIKRIVLNQ